MRVNQLSGAIARSARDVAATASTPTTFRRERPASISKVAPPANTAVRAKVPISDTNNAAATPSIAGLTHLSQLGGNNVVRRMRYRANGRVIARTTDNVTRSPKKL